MNSISLINEIILLSLMVVAFINQIIITINIIKEIEINGIISDLMQES
jgi:hypothetical protein